MFLAGVVTVIKLYISSIPNEYWGIALTFFLIWTFVRFWLGRYLRVIEEYNSIMPLIIKCDNELYLIMKTNLLNCWRYYFSERQSDLAREYYDLNNYLNKIINNPYKLINSLHKIP